MIANRAFYTGPRRRTKKVAKQMGRLADTDGFHLSKMITVGLYEVLCGLRVGATLEELAQMTSDYVGIQLSERTIRRNLKLLQLLDAAEVDVVLRGQDPTAVYRSTRPGRTDFHEEAVASVAKLSGTQREVLALMAEGLSSAEIGHRLGIATTTVDTHRSRIRKRLGITSPDGLVRLAVLSRS